MSVPVPASPPASGPTDAPTAPSNPQDNPTPPTTPGIGEPQGEPAPPTGAADVESLRAEIAEWRGKAEGAQQGIVDKIAAALGIDKSGEAPTVEQVTEQLTAAQREARERAVDLAVYRAAPTAGADPDALLDSASFRRKVADLDPSAEKFGDQVAAAIAETVKAHPRLASAPAAAPRSGAEITGGSPTGSDDLGSLSIEDYIKRTRKGRS
ncbi:hypothetical protein GCM10022243_64260 [Saccharothrix violaceirubra]|uniref:Minor structural protein GP20 n=1 Tax=Saccharothrix violaceirubra TaxID=413306 RepID=A0A7W7WZP7_9PSEU|nr:hypothetical protein [Saccharothrix violaceirubra]MBB4969091.1 hypothetical protein [Saccharothrix violaceirubra]